MLIKFAIAAWMCLMGLSFMLGLASPFFSGHKTIWKGLGSGASGSARAMPQWFFLFIY